MPCFRGISIFLTTQAKNERIDEYPHPDGSSVRLRNPREAYYDQSSSGSSRHHVFSSAKAAQSDLSINRPINPITSVYIPSVSGSTFAINYEVKLIPPAPCRFLFFKLFMNSRLIASWGTDPARQPVGFVSKSLWAPSAHYGDQVGIESRNFLFLPGQEKKSVAEDGGLIEIQVFRAQNKSPRAPKLVKFRHQDQYGIAAPSLGLLPQPEEACFYEYLLIDAKDAPYATFRYHYRSLLNLKLLSLIPDADQELLCRASSSGARAKTAEEQMRVGTDRFFPPTMSITAHKNDTLQHVVEAPELPEAAEPLPELPHEEPVFPEREAETRPSRRSSATSALSAATGSSGTFSITPSLKRAIDNGEAEDTDVEICEAQAVQFTPYMRLRDISLHSGPKLVQPLEETSLSEGLWFRTTNMAGRGSSSQLQSAEQGSIEEAQRNISPKAKKVLGVEANSDLDLRIERSAAPDEAAWMRRTPSPIRNWAANTFWSPRPREKKQGRSLLKSFRPKSRKNLNTESNTNLIPHKGDEAETGGSAQLSAETTDSDNFF